MIVRQQLHGSNMCSSKQSSGLSRFCSQAMGPVTSSCLIGVPVYRPAADTAYRQRVHWPVTHLQGVSNENSSSRSSDSISSSSSIPQVSVAVSDPSPAAKAAAAGGKDAALARIAQAKAYKQGTTASNSSSSSGGGSSLSSSSSSSSDVTSPSPEQESLQQQHLDQLRQQQQQLAAQSSSYSAYIQKSTQKRSDQDSNLEPSDLEELSAAIDDPGSGPRRSPAREDFYSNNVPSVVDLVNSAPTTAGDVS